MLSAAASLGMILLWDVDTGFSAIDKYSFSQQNYIKAGALLGTGALPQASCALQTRRLCLQASSALVYAARWTLRWACCPSM